MALLFASAAVQSSPWLEPDSVYLRSDLQALADAGLLSTTINTYPLRWSNIAEDLHNIDVSQLSPSLRQSYDHVLYALNSAQVGRGNQRFKMGYANASQADASYASDMTKKWYASSSYELAANSYAFRLTINYQQFLNKYGHEDNQFSLDNSFLAFHSGNASVSLGSVQRWWGPTWIYNLAWGHTRTAIPGVDLAYDAEDLLFLGDTHIETFLGETQSLSSNNKQWSNRIEFNPLHWLDVGFSYHKWFSNDGLDGYLDGIKETKANQPFQYSGDIRVSLPSIYLDSTTITQSVYTQGASVIGANSLGAVVYGWQSQFNVADQYLRWIVEVKQLTSDGDQAWRENIHNPVDVVGLHNMMAINNATVGPSKALKVIWVTPSNWQWCFTGQYSETPEGNNQNTLETAVDFPLTKDSRFAIGSAYTVHPSDDEDQWYYWAGLEFRF